MLRVPAIDVHELQRNGVVVVPEAVPRALSDRLVDVICGEFGIDLDDPATWYGRGDIPLPLWGHQAQWDIRQHPGLHDVFSMVYATRRLWVSLDHVAFKPPVRDAGEDEAAQALPIHWDVDPRSGRHLYQAILHLSDSPAERGAFRCVPALWHDREGWFDRHPGAGTDDIDLEGNKVIAVPCRAGDLLIFDSRMPHGNGTNTDRAPRITQAVTMQPPNFWGEAAADRIVLWETGRANPSYVDWPGFDQVQPWPPATLTLLGRRLLGLEDWPPEDSSE
jgi:hypothetical protein